MPRIAKTFRFEAAHRLQHHQGKCHSLHGHSYKVEILIEGDLQENESVGQIVVVNPSEGMILDFSELKSWWSEIEPMLDHTTLLEADDEIAARLDGITPITEFGFPPTAENIANWILGYLQTWLIGVWPQGFPTPMVKVWETETSWAQVP